jgi:hypothetical protein
LFFEVGCFENREKRRKCGESEESALPDDYYPLKLTQEMDNAWNKLVQANTKAAEAEK